MTTIHTIFFSIFIKKYLSLQIKKHLSSNTVKKYLHLIFFLLIILVVLLVSLLPLFGGYKFFTGSYDASRIYSLGKFTYFIILFSYILVFFNVIKNFTESGDDDYFSLKFFYLIVAYYIIVSIAD